MRKVAIVSLYGEYNFGNKLQNFAMEYLLREQGFETITLVTPMYQPSYVRGKLFLLDVLSILPVWKDRRFVEHRMMKKRIKMIRAFSDKYLHYSETVDYRSSIKLQKISEEYDFFITGSDQVWGSFIDQDQYAFDYYFLKFVYKEKRGSLSPSLGRNWVPAEKNESYADAFRGIKYLSCRERSMQTLIEDISGRKAELLLDPTMAVPCDVWRGLESKPEYRIPDRYILDYRLGICKDNTDNIIEEISGREGLDVLNIYDTKNRNEIFEKSGPSEFLWLIDYASLIVTDSFHGCIFSILFHKDFICLKRFEISQCTDMSDRLLTLLSRFGFESRIYHDNIPVNLFNMDYANTDNIISEECGKTKKFIRNMLKEKNAPMPCTDKK